MRAFAVVLALALAGGPAAAQDAMVVKIRGLELSSAAGAAAALERASAASLRFCRQGNGSGEADMDVTTLVCRRDMVARFVRKLGARKVEVLHAWSGGPVQLATGQRQDGAAIQASPAA